MCVCMCLYVRLNRYHNSANMSVYRQLLISPYRISFDGYQLRNDNNCTVIFTPRIMVIINSSILEGLRRAERIRYTSYGYIVQCTMYTVQCILYNVQYTMASRLPLCGHVVSMIHPTHHPY